MRRVRRSVAALVAYLTLVAACGGPSYSTSVCGWFIEADIGDDDAARFCFFKGHPDYKFEGFNLPANAEVTASIDGLSVSGEVNSSGGFVAERESSSEIVSNDIQVQVKMPDGSVMTLTESG